MDVNKWRKMWQYGKSELPFIPEQYYPTLAWRKLITFMTVIWHISDIIYKDNFRKVTHSSIWKSISIHYWLVLHGFVCVKQSSFMMKMLVMTVSPNYTTLVFPFVHKCNNTFILSLIISPILIFFSWTHLCPILSLKTL